MILLNIAQCNRQYERRHKVFADGGGSSNGQHPIQTYTHMQISELMDSSLLVGVASSNRHPFSNFTWHSYVSLQLMYSVRLNCAIVKEWVRYYIFILNWWKWIPFWFNSHFICKSPSIHSHLICNHCRIFFVAAILSSQIFNSLSWLRWFSFDVWFWVLVLPIQIWVNHTQTYAYIKQHVQLTFDIWWLKAIYSNFRCGRQIPILVWQRRHTLKSISNK